MPYIMTITRDDHEIELIIDARYCKGELSRYSGAYYERGTPDEIELTSAQWWVDNECLDVIDFLTPEEKENGLRIIEREYQEEYADFLSVDYD